MSPSIPEIVEIGGARALGLKVGRNRHLPARARRALVREVAVGDADAYRRTRGRLDRLEFVEMVVLPSHRVLDGDVQVPERVDVGHLDASPDGGLDVLEHD